MHVKRSHARGGPGGEGPGACCASAASPGGNVMINRAACVTGRQQQFTHVILAQHMSAANPLVVPRHVLVGTTQYHAPIKQQPV